LYHKRHILSWPQQTPCIDGNENIAGLAPSSFAIPLASSMTMGFAIGFMKG